MGILGRFCHRGELLPQGTQSLFSVSPGTVQETCHHLLIFVAYRLRNDDKVPTSMWVEGQAQRQLVVLNHLWNTRIAYCTRQPWSSNLCLVKTEQNVQPWKTETHSLS